MLQLHLHINMKIAMKSQRAKFMGGLVALKTLMATKAIQR